jgi:hypothetical protein
MKEERQNILLLGSDVKVNNLPVKEVSLLSKGCLPAYGYNPGDFVELLAKYKFGARSIEAVIEASSASDRLVYGLPELIAPSAARIHADWRIDLEREVDKVRKDYKLRAVW